MARKRNWDFPRSFFTSDIDFLVTIKKINYNKTLQAAVGSCFYNLKHTDLQYRNYMLFWKHSESCSVVSDFLSFHGLYSPWNSPGQNTGVGSLSLLQGIFLTQESNPGLPRCRQILCKLSHKESPSRLFIPFYSISLFISILVLI